jgi:hypothetical protein
VQSPAADLEPNDSVHFETTSTLPLQRNCFKALTLAAFKNPNARK